MRVAKHAIERQQRKARRKARDRRMRRIENRTQKRQRRPPAHAPFVEIADQQGRPPVRVGCRLEDRLGLLGAGMPEKPQMGSDDAQGSNLQVEIDDERATRLDARKLQLTDIGDGTLAQQQYIAVPAMPLGGKTGDRHRDEMGLAPNVFEIEKTGALTEPLVRFLKRNDIGTQFADHVGGPPRIEAAIGTDTFVDVVGGDDDIPAAHRSFAMNDRGAPLADRCDDPRR